MFPSRPQELFAGIAKMLSNGSNAGSLLNSRCRPTGQSTRRQPIQWSGRFTGQEQLFGNSLAASFQNRIAARIQCNQISFITQARANLRHGIVIMPMTLLRFAMANENMTMSAAGMAALRQREHAELAARVHEAERAVR
jgi:hypothetical protein